MRSQRLVAASLFAVVGVATAVGPATIEQKHRTPSNHPPVHDVSATLAAQLPLDALHNMPPPDGPFAHLKPVTFFNRNSRESVSCRLYTDSGQIDQAVAVQLDRILADNRDPKDPQLTQIDRRLLQLLFRTAYHFEASRIEITSGYRVQRRRREGLHAQGRAVDFTLADVKAEHLARYLRRLPRVGVGIYTHPRTRFVHLDVRTDSYHWLDASPPGRTWRGMSIGDRTLRRRDAGYRLVDDLPEGIPAPKN